MCKYQVVNKEWLLVCEVTKKLCDFCIFGTQNHFNEGAKMDEEEENKCEKN